MTVGVGRLGLAATGSALAVALLMTSCAGSPSHSGAASPEQSSNLTPTAPVTANLPGQPPAPAQPPVQAPARAATASPTRSPTRSPTPSPTPAPVGASPTKPPVGPLLRRVGGMSLRDKARQLIVVGFGGQRAPIAMIRTLGPGGLIYFAENLGSDAQIKAMSAASQRAARRAGQPLLIMTDQEGGPITRLPGTSAVPGGADFDGNAHWARQTADRTGLLLRRLGINTDLAPVADVNTVGGAGVIGARSFSSHPAVVSRLVNAQVCGYHQAGVATAAKHFPGHGSTTTDSHLRTAVIGESRSTWQRVDLPPFRAAIRAHSDLIMIGHLAAPALDPSGRPATISARLDRALLRDRLGFDGVVITDALNMGGITSWGDTGQNAVRAVNAGADLLLMPPVPSAAVNALVGAVREGTISVDRLDQSVERVLRLKERLGLYAAPAALPHC